MVAPEKPLERQEWTAPSPGPGEVLVEVAGCGVCHTDISFHSGKVRTNHPLPLTLGHEVSGTVVEAGSGFEKLLGSAVIVPAVLPCGECALCRSGRANACRAQKMPGNDIDGG
ncbi:MAG: alcohol dehydrogenase catalytic domain-containing protein, partial [Candidatus Wallbacteria bacterium]|nr:alcohol dehydrogenase catalytic domain-containing protein [Candidatus Wallbacteria bacterium]